MAVRVISLGDCGLHLLERKDLPRSLARAFSGVVPQVRALMFHGDPADETNWKWDWDPTQDGPFQSWIRGSIVGLSWPTKEGISVLCSAHCFYLNTGVRWDAFKAAESARRLVEDIAKAVCLSVGGRRVLFVPDTGDPFVEQAQDMFFDCRSFDEIEVVAQNSQCSCLMTI